ncbi:hypothetical protein [Saccharothrix longispora]|uniref:hypothetical protein n=1 Tax=Saccharothrix longispora TaxID=33920 RepID=UPI0028FD1D54|nr:hypothetical protein [Saccharothrix longispora]MDU0291429.1 hypothetical protein [Saccharothrix longispora]
MDAVVVQRAALVLVAADLLAVLRDDRTEPPYVERLEQRYVERAAQPFLEARAELVPEEQGVERAGQGRGKVSSTKNLTRCRSWWR